MDNNSEYPSIYRSADSTEDILLGSGERFCKNWENKKRMTRRSSIYLKSWIEKVEKTLNKPIEIIKM